MDSNSTPGPNQFGRHFYHTAWDIVSEDIICTVSTFFSHGYIYSGLNSNFLILLPEGSDSQMIENYKPIALRNFPFKIITRLLASRLGNIIKDIISYHQFVFISGKCNHDCITIALDGINCLSCQSYGGKISLKIDNQKAFDTNRWDFWLEVLRSYGFCDKFVSQIETILHSVWTLVLINGDPHGYFSCSKRVRQDDHNIYLSLWNTTIFHLFMLGMDLQFHLIFFTRIILLFFIELLHAMVISYKKNLADYATISMDFILVFSEIVDKIVGIDIKLGSSNFHVWCKRSLLSLLFGSFVHHSLWLVGENGHGHLLFCPNICFWFGGPFIISFISLIPFDNVVLSDLSSVTFANRIQNHQIIFSLNLILLFFVVLVIFYFSCDTGLFSRFSLFFLAGYELQIQRADYLTLVGGCCQRRSKGAWQLQPP